MVIYDLPAIGALHVDEAIPRRKRLGLTIFHEREGVIAGVDARIAIDPYVLISEHHLVPWEGGERLHKILANRFRCIPPSGGQRPPDYAPCIIEAQYRGRVVVYG